MNRIRFSPWPIALALAAIAMAVSVFIVTQRVQQREAHVADMNRQLLNEQQTIRVLDAEWAYLTRPQRLESLIAIKAEHETMPPTPTPIASITPEEAAVAAVSEDPARPEQIAVAKTPAEAKPAAVPEKKKISEKTETKAISVKKVSMTSKTPVKEKTKSDDVWHITPRSKAARAPQAVTYRAAPRARVGVAHPIVE